MIAAVRYTDFRCIASTKALYTTYHEILHLATRGAIIKTISYRCDFIVCGEYI